MGGDALVCEARGSHGRKNQCGKTASPDDRLYEKISRNERENKNNRKTNERDTSSQRIRQKAGTDEYGKGIEIIPNEAERVPYQRTSYHASTRPSNPSSQKNLNNKNSRKTNERDTTSQKIRQKADTNECGRGLEIIPNEAERVPYQQTLHHASRRSSNPPSSQKNQPANCGHRPGAFHISGPGANTCDIESQRVDQNEDQQGSDTLISAVLVPEDEGLAEPPPILRASKFSGYIINTNGWKFRLSRAIIFVFVVILCLSLIAWFFSFLTGWVQQGWVQENDWILIAVPTTLGVLIVVGLVILCLFREVAE